MATYSDLTVSHTILTKKFEMSDMYFDMLIPVFESQTGLYLHF